jgi:hypothetical protein
MLQRGFMGAFDIKPDRVAFATSSATNAASVGADLQFRKNLWRGFFRSYVMSDREKVWAR